MLKKLKQQKLRLIEKFSYWLTNYLRYSGFGLFMRRWSALNRDKVFYVYIANLGTGISIFINVLLAGDPYQTLSARNYHLYLENRYHWCWLINILFLDNKHCLTSYTINNNACISIIYSLKF